MIYWLLNFLSLDIKPGSLLTVRMGAAAFMSFAVVMMLGPSLIRFLIKKKVGDRPEFNHIDLNEITKHKSNTPTMGGVLIVVAIVLAVLFFADLRNLYVWAAILAAVWLGVLGGFDDWLKLRRAAGKGNRDGLTSGEKLLFQIGLGVVLSVYMYHYGGQAGVGQLRPSHHFYLPFLASPIVLTIYYYVMISTLTMVATSNAVNLTDGMDGLATGCVIIVSAVFVVVAWVAGVREWSMALGVPLVYGAQEMAIVCAAMIGACLGFLWYNAHPAQVFMGDTGSLTLGGLLGFVAVVCRQEIVLFIAGGIFVAEAFSVIIQVSVFKLTKKKGGIAGKRVFRCAPLHHHFHLGGWAETKVVTRFWIIGILLAVLALAAMRLEFQPTALVD
ncbi:MAG: phospho-N-acetylmuramoyl-pentapeptide-transferase [Phycisphaerae bacterium]|nr:phospho-N-acetylmuramoyl-pentapeptide-transferase [Phycisphaerae bacterium]